jgi:hypothetical protein
MEGKFVRNFYMNQQAFSSFIWSVADLLRGDYKQSDYGKVTTLYGAAASRLRTGRHQGSSFSRTRGETGKPL